MCTMRKVMLAIAFAVYIPAMAQLGYKDDEVVDNGDLYAPFRTVYRHVEKVDFTDDNQELTAPSLHHKNTHAIWNSGYPNDNYIRYKKVVPDAKRLNASGGLRISNDNSTVRTSSGRTSGGSIHSRNMASSKRQVDRQVAFAQQRRAANMKAARNAAQRELAKKRAAQIAENGQVAAVTAATNARLQGATNVRIAKDYYNAGQGTAIARNTAKSTADALMQGPQFLQRNAKVASKKSGSAMAKNMRQNQAKNRMRHQVPHTVYTNTNLYQPRVVRVKPNADGKYALTGRATKTQIFIKKDSRFGTPTKVNGPRTVQANKGFVLSPTAVVTTGRNPKVILPFKFAPRPVTAIRKQLSHKEEMALKIKEFLDT